MPDRLPKTRAFAGRALRWTCPGLLALALLAPIACSGDAESGSGGAGSPAPPTSPPAARCAPERPHAAGSFTETVSSDGVMREYLLHVPPSYAGDRALALVFNFHGLGSGAEEQARYSGLPAKADREGFVVVTPQGQGPIAFWNVYRIGLGAQDDVAFVRDLLDGLTEELCIDSARVYATGISNGGLMSARLACDLADRVAAVATVAGVFYPDDCSPRRPVPVLAFHGTADRIVPFEGGAVGISALRGLGLEFPPVRESAAAWAEHDGCDQTPGREQVSEHVERARYAQCDEDASVELYVIDGGGHTWPGAPVDVPRLGATTREISATDILWDFFEAHPMPEDRD